MMFDNVVYLIDAEAFCSGAAFAMILCSVPSIFEVVRLLAHKLLSKKD